MSLKAITYLVVATLTFGLTHITDKIGISKGINPWIFSFTRVLFAAFFVGVLWFRENITKRFRIERRHYINLFVIGVGASGIVALLGILAMSYTTATNKGVMQALYTAVTMIFAYFMVQERLHRRFYHVFIIMVAGLMLLTTQGGLILPNYGDWLLFLTIPIIGFCNAYAKKTMARVQALTISFGRLLFGTIFLAFFLPFLTLNHVNTLFLGLHWVFLSGILSAVYIVAFYEGVERVGPTLAAAMLSLSPLITALTEFLWLGAQFTTLQLVGIVLILGSALLLTTFEARYQSS